VSRVQYPAYIHTDDGEAALFQGHNLDPAYVEAESKWVIGEYPGYELHVTEQYYRWVPRVKNCRDHPAGDGWGCDNEGEWHGHWFPVRKTEDTRYHYTEAVHVRYNPEAES
jgi:hypothetical protein